jgi:hypothetical protein
MTTARRHDGNSARLQIVIASSVADAFGARPRAALNARRVEVV